MITLGIDTETSKKPIMHPWQREAYIVGLGVAEENGDTHTWWFNHDEIEYPDQRESIEEIQEIIDAADRLVGHNLKFDLGWLRKLSVNFDNCKLYCTQIAEYILRYQRLGKLALADLSEQYLDTPKLDKVKMFWESGYETREIPLKYLKPYLERDCLNALAIYKKQAIRLMQKPLMAKTVALQCEASRILSEIECNGMKFDVDEAKKHAKELSYQLAEIDTDLLGIFDFDCNINSGDELSAALFGGIIKREGREYYPRVLKKYRTAKDMCPLEYKSRKCVNEIKIKGLGFKPDPKSELKKGGYYSTDKGSIKHLSAKNAKQRKAKALLAERSKLQKAVESLAGKQGQNDKGLINKVQFDGCVHSKYNQTITKTGRLSSSDPNGQNLPRGKTSPIKLAIIPRYDCILGADLSQIEWIAAAFLSQDQVMCGEIRSGFDPHTDNAERFFKVMQGHKDFDETRTIAKIVSFRLIYGGSAYGFYLDPKMPSYSLQFWNDVIDAFYEKYYGLAEWQQNNCNIVYQNKGFLTSITGRKYKFNPGPDGYRRPQICNFPVQGFATADIMMLAMTAIWKRFREAGFRSKVIAQVHDSLIFDCVQTEIKAIARLCKTEFEKLPAYLKSYFDINFNLPLTGNIEVGPNYSDMKEIEIES